MITKQQAKDLSLQVWGYLKENPTLYKKDVPAELLDQIKDFSSYCSMCEYHEYHNGDNCTDSNGIACPLVQICDCNSNAEINYTNYVQDKDLALKTRVINAIYDVILNWEI